MYFIKKQKKPCVLLAHNGKKFDVPRVVNLTKQLDLLKEFKLFIKGFCDTLEVFYTVLPERKKNKLSFKQEDLAKDFLDENELLQAHNALNDVLILKKLLKSLCTDNNVIYEHTSSIEFTLTSKDRSDDIKLKKKSIADLGISTYMVNKISKAGIDKPILQKAVDTGGFEGLSLLLGENVDGKPRVTQNKKIIKIIEENLKK